MKISTAILLTATLALALASTAQADLCGELEPGVVTPCNCGDTLVTDYVMIEDLDCSAGGHGIIIGADGVTLNGNGHTIYGTTSGGSRGVWCGTPTEPRANVTIRNCRITTFFYGILMRSATACHVESNVVTNVGFNSIDLRDGSSQNFVVHNRLESSSINLLYVDDAPNNEFYHNHFLGQYGYAAYEGGTSFGNTWDGNYWNYGIVDGVRPVPDLDSADHDPHPIPHPNPGDIDQDGDIGLDDATHVTTCLAGPGVTTPPPDVDPADFAACDLEGSDGDVALADWAVIQRNFDP